MIKLALNIARLSLVAFIEACRNIVNQIAANVALFATPNPPLGDITDALDELEATLQKGLNGDRTFKALQKVQRGAVNTMMMQLKQYVETISGSNEQTAAASGIAFRKSPQNTNAISPPQTVKAKNLPAQGEIQVNWSGVKNRSRYLVYVTTDLEDVMNSSKWTLLNTTGATRFVATNLASGTRYAFIIVAVGPRNISSGPSDPAIVKAA